MKKAFLILLIVQLLTFTGCQNATGTTKTLYSTDYITVTKQGLKTTVYDKVSKEQYQFQTVRVKKNCKQDTQELTTSVDNDNLKILTGKHIIITIKANGKTVFF